MLDNETSRLSRLAAILTQLQSKRIITANEIAKKYNVSKRTIYRDIKALEAAGVPICTEEGKGYSLLEGYRLPPVMFTEGEANALITAEQLVLKNKDESFITNYSNAITKIKSVLRYETKEKAELLSQRIVFWKDPNKKDAGDYLAQTQLALTNFNLTKITYHSAHQNDQTTRIIEPFALYFSTEENWLLIAWCRLRNDYRTFRLDRIIKMEILHDKFEPHKITLQEFYEKYKKDFYP